MELSRNWTFLEALSHINETYPPCGKTGPQLRNRQLEGWGRFVGRSRALALFDDAVRQEGSLSKLGRNYNITAPTLKSLREFFENLPADAQARDKEIVETLRAAGRESQTIDAKHSLTLDQDGEKAEFVKDVVAMANNGEPSYLVIGLEDVTFKPIGRLAQRHTTNDIHNLLENKIDPPVDVDYREFEIEGNEYAILEITGRDTPYIVAADLSAQRTDRKQMRVVKGTIYVRHGDRTEGISRAGLEEMLRKRK